jgi:hypothetical protein
MDDYRHHISGHFTDRDDAEWALSTLVARGLPRERLQILETTPATPQAMSQLSWFSALVRDGMLNRQFVLIVDNRTEQDAAIAREVIQASVGDY